MTRECSECEGDGCVNCGWNGYVHLTKDEINDMKSDYEYDKWKDDKLTGDR